VFELQYIDMDKIGTVHISAMCLGHLRDWDRCKGGTQVEGVREWGAEDNIWT